MKEEVLELVLTKHAMDKGYFTASGDGAPSSDEPLSADDVPTTAQDLNPFERGPEITERR